MLDEKDLQAIAALIESSAKKTEKQIESSAEKTEKLLLDEMVRTQGYFAKEIEILKKNMEELKQYYKIDKLENNNTAILLQMIQDLRKDFEELKKKTA